MSLIGRYIVGEVLKTFLVVVAVATLLMTLGGGAQEGLRKGLPLPIVAQISPYVLPEMLRFTIPGCLLFAVCSVFGRISGAGEIVALKSAGISPVAVMWPVLAIAGALSVAAWGLYDVCASWGRPGMRRTVVESIEQIAYGVLRTERNFTSKYLSINVREVEGRRLIGPMILLEGNESRPTVSVRAEEAELYADREAGQLRIICRGGELDVAGRATLTFGDTIEQVVPFDQPQEADPNRASPAYLTSRQIPAQISREQRILWQLREAQATRDLLGEPPDEEQLNEMQRRRLRMLRLRAEPDRRLSNGFSCVCFALVGMAVAMRWRFQDNVTVFFACFLPILVIYYPLLVLGEYAAVKGLLPPMAVWLPNVALGGIGLILTRRIRRY